MSVRTTPFELSGSLFRGNYQEKVIVVMAPVLWDFKMEVGGLGKVRVKIRAKGWTWRDLDRDWVTYAHRDAATSDEALEGTIDLTPEGQEAEGMHAVGPLIFPDGPPVLIRFKRRFLSSGASYKLTLTPRSG